MSGLRNVLLTAINRVGQIIPKRLQRRIADSRGILNFFERLSNVDLVELATPEGGSLFINPLFHSNLVRSGSLRDYEPEIRKVILKFTKPGMVAYDIGANVGLFSFLFSSIVGKDGAVYSFEPEEINYRCFEKSLESYGNGNIVLDKRAVGRTKSTEEFDRRGGAFSGRLISKGQYKTTDNIRLVETIGIDYVVEAEGYRIPDILKIDVEGNEGMVLEGMRNILDAHSPIIICELHTHLGESADQVTDILSSCGYTISSIAGALAGSEAVRALSNGLTERHIVAVKLPGS